MIAARLAECEALAEGIGRSLHDDLGQTLSGIGLQLESLRLESTHLEGPMLSRLSEIQELLESAMSSVRRMSAELNSSVVERAGLKYAIEQLAAELHRQRNLDISLSLESGLRPPREIARTLFRVAEFVLGRMVPEGGSATVGLRTISGAGVVFELRYVGNSATNFAECPLDRLEFRKIQHHCKRAGLSVAIRRSGRSTIISTKARVSTS